MCVLPGFDTTWLLCFLTSAVLIVGYSFTYLPLFNIYLILIYVCICVWWYMHVSAYTCGRQDSPQPRTRIYRQLYVDPLECWEQAGVLRKSSICSEPPSHISSSSPLFFSVPSSVTFFLSTAKCLFWVLYLKHFLCSVSWGQCWWVYLIILYQ